jgi:hypothetical protein
MAWILNRSIVDVDGRDPVNCTIVTVPDVAAVKATWAVSMIDCNTDDVPCGGSLGPRIIRAAIGVFLVEGLPFATGFPRATLLRELRPLLRRAIFMGFNVSY